MGPLSKLAYTNKVMKTQKIILKKIALISSLLLIASTCFSYSIEDSSEIVRPGTVLQFTTEIYFKRFQDNQDFCDGEPIGFVKFGTKSCCSLSYIGHDKKGSPGVLIEKGSMALVSSTEVYTDNRTYKSTATINKGDYSVQIACKSTKDLNTTDLKKGFGKNIRVLLPGRGIIEELKSEEEESKVFLHMSPSLI